MYLADDDRATGLIRWLTVGTRVLTLLEGMARRRLREPGAQLTGLYAGNPTRAAARPTAESLLRTFKGLALSGLSLAGQTDRHEAAVGSAAQRLIFMMG